MVHAWIPGASPQPHSRWPQTLPSRLHLPGPSLLQSPRGERPWGTAGPWGPCPHPCLLAGPGCSPGTRCPRHKGSTVDCGWAPGPGTQHRGLRGILGRCLQPGPLHPRTPHSLPPCSQPGSCPLSHHSHSLELLRAPGAPCCPVPEESPPLGAVAAPPCSAPWCPGPATPAGRFWAVLPRQGPSRP